MIWSTVLQSHTVAGNIVTVDAVYGNDTSGKRGVASLPFLTLGAAKAAAQSGDLIWVRPGSYTVTASILKNGVNWNFMAGASVTRQLTSSVLSSILDDGGSAITSTIYGEGDFLLQMSNGTLTFFIGCVMTNNASTNLTIHAHSIGAVQDSSGLDAPMGIVAVAGTVRVECSQSIYGTDNGTGTSGVAVYWESGLTIARAPSIFGSNYAVLSSNGSSGSPVENMFIDADEIYTTGSSQSNTDPIGVVAGYNGANANAAVWVRCGTLKSNSGSSNIAVSADSTSQNKIYVASQKIFGLCQCIAGLVYVTAQKVEALQNVSGSYPALFVNAVGGTLRYNVQQHDPKAFTGIGFLINGGTFLAQGKIEYTAGSGSDGLSISSGTADLTSAYLNTAANASGFPVVKSGGTLILRGGTLVSNGTVKSINAGTAQNVVAMGAWANNSVNSNVTIVTTGGLTINSNVQ